jgi:hypothetical protein
VAAVEARGAARSPRWLRLPRGPLSNLTGEDLRYVAGARGALLLIAVGFAIVLWKAGTTIPYPLDDAFIYQRYARLLGAGEFFAYNPGEEMTSGATSPLWAALCAIPYALHLPRAASILFAGALSFGCLLLLVGAAYELTKRAAHCLASVGTVVLLAVCGYVHYFALAGMETMFFGWLLMATMLAAARYEQRPTGRSRTALLVWAALLPWGRPEGLIVLVLVAGWMAWRDGDLRAKSQEGATADAVPRAGRALAGPVWPWLPLAFVPWAMWMIALKIGTGTIEPNGLALKGLLANPTATLPEKLGFVGDALGALFTRFYANDFEYVPLREADALFHPPWLLAIAAFGFLVTAARRGESLPRPGFVLLTLATIVVGVGSTTLNESYWSHNYRYQAPYQPPLLVGYALGLWQLAVVGARVFWRDERTVPAVAEQPVATDKHHRTSTELRRDSLFLLATTSMAIILASSLPWWGSVYARTSRSSRTHGRPPTSCRWSPAQTSGSRSTARSASA